MNLDLLLKLYNASSATEIHEIVLSDTVLSDVKNWKPYGGIPNNSGSFENQQSKPEAALVEKITNSIDALLVKECMIRGMCPDDIDNPNLPRTMREAVEIFYNVNKGNWENTTETQRRVIARDLQMLVSGDKETPNIAVYDNGEGQNPEDFENTLLSLHKGNKINIPFVQGKFNMGSTGAVVFCGEDVKYQLIISRRNRELDGCSSKVGFTLVRKHILSEEEETTMKSTWYEYLIIDDEIPSFECESIDFGLDKTDFVDGTIVKMYSYQLSSGCRSNATLDLWRELNTLLYETSIPLLIYEKRDYRGHSKTKLMLGNKSRLSIDDREKRYLYKSFSINDSCFGAEIPIDVTIFKLEIEGSEFVRKKPVIFITNGQTQGVENKTFVSSDLDLRQLKNNILISVDCTNINTSSRSELFMASRDRMKEGKNYELLKNKIVSLLKDDEDLKQANQDFKGAVVRESKDDKALIENLFSNLKDNREIRKLLSGISGDISFFKKKSSSNGKPETSKKDGKKGQEQKKLKRFPSIFKVKDLQTADGENYKAIPKGSKGTIKIETDVENEFLVRNEDQGKLEISILDYSDNRDNGESDPVPYPSTIKNKIKVQRSGPFNGEIKLMIEPDKDVNVGDVFPLSVKLISSAGENEVIVFIKIEKERTEKKPAPNSNKDEPDLNLPKAIRVLSEKEDGEDTATWAERGMTAKSIIGLGIGEKSSLEAIYINMDSNLMKKLINRKGINVELISKKYFSSIYAHALMLYTTLIGYYSSDNTEFDDRTVSDIIDNMDKTIEFIFEYYGGFLLSFEAQI